MGQTLCFLYFLSLYLISFGAKTIADISSFQSAAGSVQCSHDEGGISVGISLDKVVVHVPTITPKGCDISWSEWSSCSMSCGNGTQERTASCPNCLATDPNSKCMVTETRVCMREECQDTCDLNNLRLLVGPQEEEKAYILNVSDGSAETLPTKTYVLFVATDKKYDFFFYTDGNIGNTESVYLYNLTSKEDRLIVTSLGGMTFGIEIDDIRQFLFVSVRDKGIIVMDYEGRNVKPIVTEPVFYCIDLATDTEKGLLYWTDYKGGKVEMINYSDVNNPTSRTVIAKDLPHYTRGIWWDKNTELLYFSLYDGRIYEVPPTAPRQIREITNGPCSGCRFIGQVVKCQDTLFYTDDFNDGVFKITRSNPERIKVNKDYVGLTPKGLAII